MSSNIKHHLVVQQLDEVALFSFHISPSVAAAILSFCVLEGKNCEGVHSDIPIFALQVSHPLSASQVSN
ncbi:unnamed protein product [Amoebophrya sp. A120]|nr:unnamed protein product [Amoebophrya sp. A120]|eukprot:GSA120T00014909001.1